MEKGQSHDPEGENKEHCGEKADLEKGQSHDPEGENKEEVAAMRIQEYASSPKLPRKSALSALSPLSEFPVGTRSSEKEPLSESSTEYNRDASHKVLKVRKWPTQWYWQFMVLLVRTFRQSRHVILSKLDLIETILLTAISSIIWFQLPNNEGGIADRYGSVSL